MTTKVTPVQLLRSEVLNKRPDPQKLLPGQGAVNTDSTQPGLFFADDTGNSLFKVGPCSVGPLPPNDPAIAPIGAPGNTLGELWLDTRGLFPTLATNIVAGETYRINTVGTTNFVAIGASNNSVGIIFTATGPGTGNGTVTDADVLAPYPQLRVWDGTSWISAMPYTYANTIVSDTPPTINYYPDGTMWWDSGTGLMYVLYNDGTSRQWTQVSSTPVQ